MANWLQVLTPLKSFKNIFTDFFWETSQKLFEEIVVIIFSHKKKKLLTMSENQSDGWCEETDKQNILPIFLA